MMGDRYAAICGLARVAQNYYLLGPSGVKARPREVEWLDTHVGG